MDVGYNNWWRVTDGVRNGLLDKISSKGGLLNEYVDDIDRWWKDVDIVKEIVIGDERGLSWLKKITQIYYGCTGCIVVECWYKLIGFG